MTPQELKTIFESPYDQTSWVQLIREVFGVKRILLRPQPVDTTDNKWQASALELGSFETVEGMLVGVYEVKIDHTVKLERNKVGLRNLLRPIYKNDVDAALIVFDQGEKWRFSYVSEIRVRNKHTGKRERKTTDPKRYTYLFGTGQHCRTAAERFDKVKQHYNLFGGAVKLDEIEKAFSVDTLTKNFYEELSDWYFRALKEVKFPDDTIPKGLPPEEEEKERQKLAATGTIRLITRLIFVWFLKQKDLVPDELFQKDELDKILHYRDKTGSTFYKAILQNLFFATLNTEMGDENRKFVDRQYGIQGYYRYKRFFKDADRFLSLTARIPFLNGGLFENLDKNVGEKGKEIRIDCFSNKLENEEKLSIPDGLFYDTQTVDLSSDYGDKKKKSRKVRGLIDILQSYNFTIEENTPFEIEVALDPELLGKVFENLLASYNPETGATARKMTGSFYTPREIVDYMVDESLISYLTTGLEREYPATAGTDVWNPKLRQLFSYTTELHLFSPEEAETIINALDAARILDPACGSGAFPMGVLHKMVFLLNKLDADNVQWRELQKQKALRETAEAYELGDREERDMRLKDISEAFEDNSDDYGRKLYLIENCIYGVDIQPIAVQIAKLRFFISLVVDQQDSDKKKNRGIRPLPNLETKFVAANTLIGLEKPKQLPLGYEDVKALENKLDEVRHKHFSAKTPKTKAKYRTEDLKIRDEIAEKMKSLGFPNNTATQIAHWNPYDQNTSATFFDREYMFNISDGFDIVIGNPPYVSHDKINSNEKDHYKNHYVSYSAFADLYCYFMENSIDILKQFGISCFITSNSFLRADYGSLIRKYISKFCDISQLISIEESQVFDSAIVNTSINIFQKGHQPRSKAYIVKSSYDFSESFTDFIYHNRYEYWQTNFSEKKWLLLSPEHLSIIQKIEKDHATLESLNTKIRLGLATGDNDAFVIPESKKDEFERENPQNSLIIKPVLRGREIDRFGYSPPKDYILLTKNGINVERDFPSVYRYFDSLGEKFKKRGAKGQHWTNLRACSFFDDFAKEKIVWIELSDSGRFALCTDEIYLLNSAYFLLPPMGYSAKYLLSILNSSLIQFYLRSIADTSGMGTSRWINNHVKEFPIPKIVDANLIEKVTDILIILKSYLIKGDSKFQEKADTTYNFFEQLNDAIVYELYFPEALQAAGCEVLKHLTDLPDISTYSNAEKSAVIQQVYERLSHREHPVRIALFNMDTVDEVAIIEGKKK